MTRTIEATAWTLIHFCWQAAVIAGAWRIVSIGLTRRASQARYVAALAALLVMPAVAQYRHEGVMRNDEPWLFLIGSLLTLAGCGAAVQGFRKSRA